MTVYDFDVPGSKRNYGLLDTSLFCFYIGFGHCYCNSKASYKLLILNTNKSFYCMKLRSIIFQFETNCARMQESKRVQ